MKNRHRIMAIAVVLLFCINAGAQSGLYNSMRSKASFFSSAPLEDISAVNTEAVSSINAATGEITVRIPIKGFRFENDLMEEHFNDHYLESEKYPAALFKGKINEAVDWKRLGKVPVSATGTLTIHGVERPRSLQGSLIVGNNGIQLDAKFPVKLSDHNIKIPKLVFQKIAEVVEVTCQFVYAVK